MTDECSLAGVVRAHLAAIKHNLHLIVGSEFRLDDGLKLLLLASDRDSYGKLSTLITLARRQAGKGRYRLSRSDLAAHLRTVAWQSGYPAPVRRQRTALG